LARRASVALTNLLPPRPSLRFSTK
jgi:hypothetical protein